MKKSALQEARAAYQPKLPKALKGSLTIKEGAATQSVADQEAIKELFPNTYGMPVLTFEPSNEVKEYPAINIGVILSGGITEPNMTEHNGSVKDVAVEKPPHI